MFGQGFLALSSSLLLVNAGGGACPAHPDPAVEVALNIERPSLNTRLSRSQIEEMTLGMDGTKSPYRHFKKNQYIGSGMYVTFGKGGVTIPSTELEAEIVLDRIDTGNLLDNCYALGVKITIDSSSEVYIANSYKRGSCEYKAVMRHENRHVVTEHKALRYYKKIMEAVLTKAAREFIAEQGGESVSYNTAEATQAAFSDRMNGVIQSLWDKMGEEIMAAQQRLDTHEEYSKVRKECAYLDKYRFLKNRQED